MALRLGKSPAAALRFAIHVIVAVALFGLISAAAVALNQLTVYLEHRNLAPAFVVMGMKGLEYVLWAADFVMFGWLIIAETVKLSLLVWAGLRE